MVMECINSTLAKSFWQNEDFRKVEQKNNNYNYILEHMDCEVANNIEQCVTDKLTCIDDVDNARELAKEFIWAISDAICMIRYESSKNIKLFF